jgi:positive regulator of sigma E activity
MSDKGLSYLIASLILMYGAVLSGLLGNTEIMTMYAWVAFIFMGIFIYKRYYKKK